jgi:hypothetical protein
MLVDQVGVILESGLSDWQIVQQDETGHGTVTVSGRYVSDLPGSVEVRLVSEETGGAVNGGLDWRPAASADGSWSATIDDIPAGGLYRLETRFNAGPDGPSSEWSQRGDMRHFVGVGDLWVIAGQSNSAGYGRGPLHDPPELGLHLFRNSERWSLASHPMNESTDTRHPANREGGNPGHSPYLHFARVLKRELGSPIGLVQTALGGSPLTHWNPEEPGESPLFENMVHCVQQAGGSVRGILWYQGESDASGENARTYADRFIRAVTAWRKALNAPSLPVITVQLNRFYGPPDDASDRGWSLLREAQRQLPHRLEGVAVVPTLDLPLTDGIHTGPAGNMVLGERMAQAALSREYGRSTEDKAPDLQRAQLLADEGLVELIFDHVTSRMDTIDRFSQPFRVEDDAGEAPIIEVIYPADSRILLRLERPLQGQGRVHGAYGFNPSIVPMDMERALPMLGFYDVEIEP